MMGTQQKQNAGSKLVGFGLAIFLLMGLKGEGATNLIFRLSFNAWEGSSTIISDDASNHLAINYATITTPPSNAPALGVGIDGSPAMRFRQSGHVTGTGIDTEYVCQGSYLAVTNLAGLTNMAAGTIMVWAKYDSNSFTFSQLLDAGFGEQIGGWRLGRDFGWMGTLFSVWASDGNQHYVGSFPDYYDSGGSPLHPEMGNSTAWHHYAITFDGTTVYCYLDGIPCSTNAQLVSPLTIGNAAGWFAIGCAHHNSPITTDCSQGCCSAWPNSGWFSGTMDDIRIYSSSLTAGEVSAAIAGPTRYIGSLNVGAVNVR